MCEVAWVSILKFVAVLINWNIINWKLLFLSLKVFDCKWFKHDLFYALLFSAKIEISIKILLYGFNINIMSMRNILESLWVGKWASS